MGGAEGLIPLNADELKRTARELSGLDDFGEFPWEEALHRLLWSFNNEAQLTTLGRLITRSEILRTLNVRLRLTAFWKEHPEALTATVRAPIIIAGAARTGTSILQEVLSQDKQFHIPYTWKCLNPLPLFDDREQDMAVRKECAECGPDFWVDVQPELRAMHDFGVDLPIECVIFMSTDYSSDYWSMVANLPTWNAWRLENDYAASNYIWHKRLLQTMQFNEPQSRVWLLKSPAHLAFLETLKATYPDVRIIHTHRDPVKCIPSTVNAASTFMWIRSSGVDYKEVGKRLSSGFQFFMDNVINQRINGRLPESQIVDIQLPDLINRPVETIRNIYDYFGLTLPENFDKNILDYLKNKPKGKFGKHTYDMGKFGMSEALLRQQFRRYTDYYQIEPEG